MAASAAAGRAATAASSSRASMLDRLFCATTEGMRTHLRATSRVAALDVTPTHISLALSDRPRRTAAPFGVLARTRLPSADAKLLSSALQAASRLDNDNPLDVHALVIGLSPLPHDASETLTYVRALLPSLDDSAAPFPVLKACLLYSEAHALRHALTAHEDFISAIRLLPARMENIRRSRFATAMNPVVTQDDLVDSHAVRARFSATDLLQVVLDDLSKLDRQAASNTQPKSLNSTYRPWVPSSED